MKKTIRIILLILFLVASYLIILGFFPKNANRFPFLALLFLGDLYVFSAVKIWINQKKNSVRYLLSFAYWLPLFLLILAVATSVSHLSDKVFRNATIYMFGFIFSAYAAKILPILFLLIADLIKGVRHVNHKVSKKIHGEQNHSIGDKITRSEFLKKAGLAGGGLIFSSLIFGMLKWVYDFKIHRVQIHLPYLPASFDGLKIVQISDMHLGSWASSDPLDEAITKINSLQPDLVFFTGDLVNYKTDEAFPFMKALQKVRARYGVFATLGNHDYGDYTRWPTPEAKKQNMTDLYHFYNEIGWKLLNNENQLLEIDGEKIAVIGVENWGAFSRFPRYGDIEKASQGTEDVKVKLLLSHDPSHWEEIVTKQCPDIDVTFAGHTHGFQFGIEIKKLKWSPAQYVYKYWAGLYENLLEGRKPQYLYVNRGLGTIGYPGRVGILPEITLFELKA